ncbi:MAG: macro domain-containing protein, partial [Bdellovibrionales bacterium]
NNQMTSNQEAKQKIKVTQGSFFSVTDVGAWGCFVTQDMSWDGQLNQAILAEAGEEFDAHVLEHIFQPKAGQVFCLPAFSAPVDRIVLGVIPTWRDGLFDEEQLVIRCYKNLMKVVSDHNIDSLALPSLGGGQRNFPQKRIVRLTLAALIDNMPDCLETLHIVCKDEDSFSAYQERLS